MDARGPRLTAIGRRELGLAALVAVVLSIVMHWPLPLHLDGHVARDIGDPIVQAWQVAWGGHALAHQPFEYFQANTFYPVHDSLAFSDALTGYAPSGLIGDGVDAAIVRYNLLFLFAYALAFLGAYLLARELGLGPLGAVIAGAAFAYAPWRLEQDGHLHVISSGGIPLALFLLLRGYRGRRAGMVLGGWFVVAWQFSLGFTLGLQLGYLLAVLGAIAAIWWWRGEDRPRPSRNVVIATLAGIALLGLTAIVLARPYQRVLDHYPEATRTSEQLSGLSGPPAQFVAAPEHNLIWSGATAAVRDDELTSVAEQTLFPGLVILALAIAGAFVPALPRAWRIGLGAGVLVCAVLSLGFHTAGAGRFYPYRLLYEFAPGWSGIRVPGRLNTLTSLGLALLAAAGAQYLLTRLRAGRVAVAALLVGLICLEGAGSTTAVVPKPPPGQRGVAAPQLHLPITVPGNRRYVLWSSDGFPKIVNGRGSFDPDYFDRLTKQMRTFPDRRSVALLRSIGVRSVVLHPNLAVGSAWQGAELRPVSGLGVDRQVRPGVVVYRLVP